MQCPKCVDTSLKRGQVKAKSLVFDQCSICEGIWLDNKELIAFLGDSADKPFSVPSLARPNVKAKCPNCCKDLYEFCYPGTIVLVDACKSCYGIWLDNNEWEEIGLVRDAKNYMHCPKCWKRQPKSDSCTSCGIINKEQGADRNDADNIPGLKGKLLRFIDASIESLTNY